MKKSNKIKQFIFDNTLKVILIAIAIYAFLIFLISSSNCQVSSCNPKPEPQEFNQQVLDDKYSTLANTRAVTQQKLILSILERFGQNYSELTDKIINFNQDPIIVTRIVTRSPSISNDPIQIEPDNCEIEDVENNDIRAEFEGVSVPIGYYGITDGHLIGGSYELSLSLDNIITESQGSYASISRLSIASDGEEYFIPIEANTEYVFQSPQTIPTKFSLIDPNLQLGLGVSIFSDSVSLAPSLYIYLSSLSLRQTNTTLSTIEDFRFLGLGLGYSINDNSFFMGLSPLSYRLPFKRFLTDTWISPSILINNNINIGFGISIQTDF